MQRKAKANKALEVVLYVLSKGCTNLYNVLKVIYYADKEHIRLTGNTMYKEQYIAMQKGPVPSCAYDIIKSVRGDGIVTFDGLDEKEAFKFVSKNNMCNLRNYNEDFFSVIDYKCLDDAISSYGSTSMDELTRISHM